MRNIEVILKYVKRVWLSGKTLSRQSEGCELKFHNCPQVVGNAGRPSWGTPHNLQITSSPRLLFSNYSQQLFVLNDGAVNIITNSIVSVLVTC